LDPGSRYSSSRLQTNRTVRQTVLILILAALVSCQDRFPAQLEADPGSSILNTTNTAPPTLTPLFTVPPPVGTALPTASLPTPIQDSLGTPFSTPVIVVSFDRSDDHLPGIKATSPAPDPLRFTFSTPAPPPVSAWRPPLYDIPWAPSPFDHFYFARPVAADEVNWPLWDYRYGGSFFANVIHTGIDIPVRNGTPILAAGPGKVVWAGYGLYRGGADPSDPYGLAVSILHDFGHQGQKLHTVYAHLDQVDVARGQYVETGDVLGLSGSTGHVTGPHLHFEVRLGENDFFTTYNPELWLVPAQGWGVLVGRVTNSGGVLVTEQMVIIRSKTSGQNWMAKSYGNEGVNSDPYYRENLVISDLPAGEYELRIPYQGFDYKRDVEIRSGLVTYFTFKGHSNFSFDPPPTPGNDFTPSP
jgi:murein DD-endopeptidase MepM/ murein hydrolase activator NlpD